MEPADKPRWLPDHLGAFIGSAGVITMRNLVSIILMLALAGCAASRDSASAPQKAVVESETARQTAATAVASDASPDEALERAAAARPPGEQPKP